MSSKQCPQCQLNVPAAASVCGYCGLNFQAYSEAQRQERLANARSFGFLTYPLAVVVGLAMAGWILTWDITWGWKALWLVLLPVAAGALAFEWALPAIGMLIALGLVVAVVAALGK